jgi:peptidyl-prolyl cis-trans isomerase SurA
MLISAAAMAQYSPNKVLLSINNYKVTAEEFERIYNKNYNINAADKQSVEDYFDLFLKFRLKVDAAIDAGMDSSKAFKDEFSSYRKQLAKTYLTDNTVMDSLIKQAYYRTKNEVAVSHIMVRLPQNASPADTLKAYQKIMDIRKRLEAGEPFEKVAQRTSEDQSVSYNKGFLGYSRAFRFPYSFECAMYSTQPGQVSMPVRTNYGYHLIKVKETRPSKGEVKVAHIMISHPRVASDSLETIAKQKIDSIYKMALDGTDFKVLAKTYSNDHGTEDGELPWFGSGRMIPEFEDAAFAIQKKGEICAPISTSAGWHIIKLIDSRPVPSFADARNDLKSRISNDERSLLASRAFINTLKKEYNYKINNKTLANFYLSDSLLKAGKINVSEATLKATLFTINKEAYKGAAFKAYLESHPIEDKKMDTKVYIDNAFNSLTEDALLAYEDKMLEKKYPEFKNLVAEYHDGILLFNIMDKQVWSKASQDTTGLQAFYSNVWVKGKEQPQKLEEAKGLVTSDYQNFLEEQWIGDLKKTYKIVIDKELLTKIAKKYQK